MKSLTIEDIKKMYIQAGNKNNVLVFPVGIAFENAYANLLYIVDLQITISKLLYFFGSSNI